MVVAEPDGPDEKERAGARDQKRKLRRGEATKALVDVRERARAWSDAVVVRLNWDRIGLAISCAIVVLLLADRVSILLNATSTKQNATSISQSTGSNQAMAEAPQLPGPTASASLNRAIQTAPEAATTDEEVKIARDPTPSPGRMDVEDIVALRRQGLELLANGDFVAGRLALQRAAEAGDAEASAALERTYDPQVPRLFGVDRVAGDLASEQAIYQTPTRVTKRSASARWR
jgi:hypothetical protein